MPRAHNLIREQPWYRRSAFDAGLKAAGYAVDHQQVPGAKGDLLLIWNRYNAMHELASRFEREGGTVLVAENGYIGKAGTSPKFDVHPIGPQPHHYYAIATGYHNDDTRIPAGGPDRFAALGVELKPWRTAGKHVLVCPNRPFGPKERAMPPNWPDVAAGRLRALTGREVRVRAHPGNDAPKRPLAADLAEAWAVVIWSSGAGVHALAAGIPVFCEAPFWILKGAAASGTVDEPVMPDRLPAFQRMAWGQFTCAEIEAGLPFRHLGV